MIAHAPHSVWIAEFLEDRAHTAGLAASSLLSLRLELCAWQRWLDAQGVLLHEVTPAVIRAWLGLQVNRAEATVERKIWALRSFYRWAFASGLIEIDPWLSIARPRRQPRWQPRFTPPIAAVSRLLAQPDRVTPVGIRDRTILELLYATGLRASELLSLECHQITHGLAHRTIHVMGKGGKERVVVYHDAAQTWLRYYLRVARPWLLDRHGRSVTTSQFFVQPSISAKFTYTMLRALIRDYAEMAGLPLLTAHALRHAFAAHLYQAGANLRAIQMLLGHSCLSTTCVYARPSVEQLSQLIERHHPRGLYYQPLRRVRWFRDHSQGRDGPSNDAQLEENPVPTYSVYRWLLKTAT